VGTDIIADNTSTPHVNHTGKDSSFLRSFVGSQSTLPPFPVDSLPNTVRDLVSQGAASIDVPPDLIAAPLLTYGGATIGNSLRLQLKPGWEEYPILYTSVVAVPGSGKTPSDSLARRPLDVLQDIAYQDERFSDHLFTTDSTMEAFAPMLKQSRGLALSVDETAAWILALDKYRGGKGGDKKQWLSLWSGRALKIDRKHGDRLYIPKPVVGVTGGIQPGALSSLAPLADAADGFIERILWSYPRTWPVGWTTDVVSASVQAGVFDIFKTLRSGPSDGIVYFSPEALGLWAGWHAYNQTLVGSSRGIAAGMHAKMPTQLPRIALVLHALAYPDAASKALVSCETLSSSIEIVEYFRAHGLAVFRSLQKPRASVQEREPMSRLASRIVDFLTRSGDWVGRTEIYAHLGRNPSKNDLTGALQELQDLRIVESRCVRGLGRPQEQWRLTTNERTNEESAA
jgi:hypothetical protein